MTTDPIEAMARAIARTHSSAIDGSPEAGWTCYVPDAREALAAYRETPEFKGLVSERDRLKAATLLAGRWFHLQMCGAESDISMKDVASMAAEMKIALRSEP